MVQDGLCWSGSWGPCPLDTHDHESLMHTSGVAYQSISIAWDLQANQVGAFGNGVGFSPLLNRLQFLAHTQESFFPLFDVFNPFLCPTWFIAMKMRASRSGSCTWVKCTPNVQCTTHPSQEVSILLLTFFLSCTRPFCLSKKLMFLDTLRTCPGQVQLVHTLKGCPTTDIGKQYRDIGHWDKWRFQ